MRSQAEIIGFLLLVVLLIVVGGLFLLLSRGMDTNDEIMGSIKAENLLSAIITLMPCNDNQMTVRDIIKEGSMEDMMQCNGLISKKEEALKKIIEDVMLAYDSRITYSFRLVENDAEMFAAGNCIGDKVTDKYPIRTKDRLIEAWMSFCKRL
jgi:hypothetical protein